MLMISIFLSLLVAVFALQNSILVPIQFFFWSTEFPLVLIILISVFIGAIIIFSLALWREMKRKIIKVSNKASEIKEKHMTKNENQADEKPMALASDSITDKDTNTPSS